MRTHESQVTEEERQKILASTNIKELSEELGIATRVIYLLRYSARKKGETVSKLHKRQGSGRKKKVQVATVTTRSNVFTVKVGKVAVNVVCGANAAVSGLNVEDEAITINVN